MREKRKEKERKRASSHWWPDVISSPCGSCISHAFRVQEPSWDCRPSFPSWECIEPRWSCLELLHGWSGDGDRCVSHESEIQGSLQVQLHLSLVSGNQPSSSFLKRVDGPLSQATPRKISRQVPTQKKKSAVKFLHTFVWRTAAGPVSRFGAPAVDSAGWLPWRRH